MLFKAVLSGKGNDYQTIITHIFKFKKKKKSCFYVAAEVQPSGGAERILENPSKATETLSKCRDAYQAACGGVDISEMASCIDGAIKRGEYDPNCLKNMMDLSQYFIAGMDEMAAEDFLDKR